MPLRRFLRTPGVAGPFGASLVARLPLTAIALLLVLHVRELSGGFGLAGLAAGLFTLGMAVGAPVVGRLIDRAGQLVVLAPCGAVATAALAAIALVPADAPAGVVLALAVVTGIAMPPLGSTLRALWMDTVDDTDRHVAFALDGAAVELLYVVGPVTFAGGIGAWSLRAAFGIAAACVAVGTALYLAQRATRGWRPVRRTGGLAGPLAAPAVRALLLVALAAGAAGGGIEVGVATVADAAGHAGSAGALLGLWGLGSGIGALLIARRPAPDDPGRALVSRAMAFGLAHAALVVTTEPLLIAPLLLLAGLTLAPTVNGLLVLLGEAAPPGTVTEAFTWSTCGITGGVAVGAAASGVLAEHLTRGPFLVAGAAALATTAVAFARRPVLMAVRA